MQLRCTQVAKNEGAAGADRTSVGRFAQGRHRYLAELWQALHGEMREAGLVMVRYADDAVVLCRSREEAEVALPRMRAWGVRTA